MTKNVRLLYGKEGMEISVPDWAVVLEGQSVPAMPNPDDAIARALANPIGCESLAALLARKQPRTVAITVSDITRTVPNRQFLPAILKALNAAGIADSQIVVIVGTGTHRRSTPQEHELILGPDILKRVEVIDHDAHDPATLRQVSSDPPVSVCRRFLEADFRIVTGFIEPHFMAGYSGGRKGLCPALVDLRTVQRFHGYETLADPRADTGNLQGNPCNEIALKIAHMVGVDFLFNVAITRDRRIAGIYCGDMEQAHIAGCRDVERWTTATFDEPFDLVITNGGGYPLDQTFYQTVKGMCTALPAVAEHSTLLIASMCDQMLGSQAYTDLVLRYDGDWRRFLADLAANKDRTLQDQWQYQMQCRVLERIGVNRLWFVSDGLPMEMMRAAAVNPIICEGNCPQRMQMTIDEYTAANPTAHIAVIPDGPYTMLKKQVVR